MAASFESQDRIAVEIEAATGKQFGELTVLRRCATEKVGQGNRARVEVRCSCGRERSLRWTDVKSGNTSTCGTLEHRMAMLMARHAECVGQTFGLLTVTKIADKTGRHGAMVWTECACGQTTLVDLSSLVRGHKSQCGGPAHKTSDGDAAALPRRWRVDGVAKTYAIEAMGAKVIKIGTARDLESRLRKMQFVSPVELHVFAVCETNIERQLHKELDLYRSHGEWFHKNETVLALVAQHMRPMSLSMLKSTRVKPGRQGPVPCKFCGELGHYAKTCRARFTQAPVVRPGEAA